MDEVLVVILRTQICLSEDLHRLISRKISFLVCFCPISDEIF
jgi:hypothetical protein